MCVARITMDACLIDWGAPNGLHTCQGKMVYPGKEDEYKLAGTEGDQEGHEMSSSPLGVIQV